MKNFRLYFVLLIGLLAFSCAKEPDVMEEKPAANPMESLIVPDNFTWKLYQDVNLRVMTPLNGQVLVKDASGNVLVRTNAEAMKYSNLIFGIPTKEKKIFIEFNGVTVEKNLGTSLIQHNF